MTSISFSISQFAGATASALITLEELSNGVKVTVVVDKTVANGDITGVFFDVANNDLAGLRVAKTGGVTAVCFGADRVLQVGHSSIQGGIHPFDAGVAIGTTSAKDFFSTASFIVQGATLSDFNNQRFGVRLQSVNNRYSTSSKLVGQVPQLLPATLGNVVFLDQDGDGLQDQGEAGISHVTVKLLDSSGSQVLATTTTDEHGFYSFSTRPGTYKIQFVAPTGYSFSPKDQGSNDAIDSDADPLTGLTGPITIGAGETNHSIDAGLLNVKLNAKLSFDLSSSTVLTERPFDEDGVDSNGDGKLEFVNTPFLIPESNGTFVQKIEVTNSGTTTANNTVVAIRGIHPFVKLTSVLGAGSTITGVTTVGDTTTYLITIPTIAAGQTVVLDATSQVINEPTTVNLTPTAFDFTLEDDPNSTADFGDATVSGTFYFSEIGYTKATGQTAFSFDPFARNLLEVDLGADNTIDASQALSLLRMNGTLNAGDGTTHRIYSPDAIEGDIDPLTRWKPRVASNPTVVDVLQLVWNLSPNISAQEFQALVDSSGPGGFDLFINAIEQGLFSRSNAAESFTKDGQTFAGQFNATTYAPDGTVLGSFAQAAQAGNLITTDSLKTVTFTGGSFQAFVNALNVNFSYRIILQSASTIDFSQYAGTPPIVEMVLPSGKNTLTINNRVDKARLDLRSIRVLKANGSLANVVITGDCGKNVQVDNIVGTIGADTINGLNGSDILNGFLGDDILNGGSGSDVMNGGQGNDRLSGGHGVDKFVFDKLFGNDRITDFSYHEKIDLKALGLTSSQLASSINGNIVNLTAFNGGVITVTNVSHLSVNNFILA